MYINCLLYQIDVIAYFGVIGLPIPIVGGTAIDEE
jgi:hypothetical protein